MKPLIAPPKIKLPSLPPSRGRAIRRGAIAATVPASAEKPSGRIAAGHDKTAPLPRRKRVTFDWFFPKAAQVAIAGSFNNWHPTATPLRACGGGRWLLTILLAPGRYPFRFVVDGQWADDPGVTSRFLFVN